MPAHPKPASYRAVDDIISDLTDRRGLRQEWEGIDKPIQREIRDAWPRLPSSGASVRRTGEEMSFLDAFRVAGDELQDAWIKAVVALGKELGVTGETHTLVTSHTATGALCGWFAPKDGPYDPVFPQITIQVGDGYFHVVRIEQDTAAGKDPR